MTKRAAGWILAVAAGACFAACGGKVVVDRSGEAQGASVTSGGVGGSGGQGGAAEGGGGSAFDGGPDALPPPPPAVYAAGESTLYLLAPATKVVSLVGSFSGCTGGVIDIAVDRTGAIWATTKSGLYHVDPKTAACKLVAEGAYPNSLSFVPQGTVDPDAEALVGYAGSTYLRFDTVTGEATELGSLGDPGLSSSGDLVSIIGGGTYLTVVGENCSDCLVEVDPKTGAMLKKLGALPYAKVFGLAYWDGIAYGFNSGGEIFTIDLPGTGTKPVSYDGPLVAFWGAGSSTAAPK